MTAPLTLALVGLISVAGSFVQASTGFGYAVTVMALWPLFLPYKTALVVELLAALALCVVIAVRYRRSINWRQLIAPCAASFFTNWLGLQIMSGSPDTVLRRLLGAALMALAVYFIFFSEKFRVRPTLAAGLIAGGVAGLSAGMFSIGGPPIVVYYLAAFQDKKEYTATTQMYFCVGSVYNTSMRIFRGILTADMLPLVVLGVAGMAAGERIGLRILRRIDVPTMKKAVYVFLALSGVITLVRNLI